MEPSAPASEAPRAPTERRRVLRTLAAGKRFEAYVEQQTSEMRRCVFCDRIFYRKKPMKQIGARWVCIDCLKGLKETLDGLDRWEEMSALHETIERDVREGIQR